MHATKKKELHERNLNCNFKKKTQVEIYFSTQQACVAILCDGALYTIEKNMSTLKWGTFERQD